jgi:hypothetical protein
LLSTSDFRLSHPSRAKEGATYDAEVERLRVLLADKTQTASADWGRLDLLQQLMNVAQVTTLFQGIVFAGKESVLDQSLIPQDRLNRVQAATGRHRPSSRSGSRWESEERFRVCTTPTGMLGTSAGTSSRRIEAYMADSLPPVRGERRAGMGHH